MTWGNSFLFDDSFDLIWFDFSLGKTIQTIVLLSALFDSDVIKHVLIIAPISLLQNWHDEFAKW